MVVKAGLQKNPGGMPNAVREVARCEIFVGFVNITCYVLRNNERMNA